MAGGPPHKKAGRTGGDGSTHSRLAVRAATVATPRRTRRRSQHRTQSRVGGGQAAVPVSVPLTVVVPRSASMPLADMPVV